MEMVEKIQQIIDQNEYRHYGVRVHSSLCDQFEIAWLKSKRLPHTRRDLKMGQIALRSYRWDDNDFTRHRLNGTCAIGILGSDVATALDILTSYIGHQLVLLGADHVEIGEDRQESIMHDAVVLAIFPYTGPA